MFNYNCRVKDKRKEKKQQAVCFLLIVTSILGILISCNKLDKVSVVTEYVDFDEIDYEPSQATQQDGFGLDIELIKLNNPLSIELQLKSDEILVSNNYILVDWGDGTWSYTGPYLSTSTMKITHEYKKSGEYSVRAASINLQNGRMQGWSEPIALALQGDSKKVTYINNVKTISSGSSEGYSEKAFIDGNNETIWRSNLAENINEQAWAGYLFDKHYSLGSFEVKVSATCEIWPSNIAVEYTTDGGETWYALPKYYYLYEYSKDRYMPLMEFPNPKGATLIFNMDGIVANGVRFSSKMYSLDATRTDKYLEIAEMRVTSKEEPLFYTSIGETFDADLNNFWTIMGRADTEPSLDGSWNGPNPDPFRSGAGILASTEWLEWDGMQILWGDDNQYFRDFYTDTLLETIVAEDGWGNYGYVWATIHAPQHLDYENHYTYNAILILAARNYLFMQDPSAEFLNKKNSRGQTMMSRLEDSMEYMLTVLEGSSGIMIIKDPENNATPGAKSSNYWDAITAFGYKSAYENVYFYRSLLAMADIYEHIGENEKVGHYIGLAKKVKQEYNTLFWDNDKGRYITSINPSGERIDFGITFVNFLAVEAGLASEEQAIRIYDWIDGNAIIEGEASQGADIYHFVTSARSNTVDISSIGPPYYWWDHDGKLPCTPGTLGGYGNTMQNGGTILYISHYDLMARLNVLGADNAFKRFRLIMQEFHKDEMRRFPYTNHGGYVNGVIGEFPESGLVPLTFVKGFLGINPCRNGILINPKLPKEIEYAGVNRYMVGDIHFSIEVSKKQKTPETIKDNGIIKVKIPAQGKWIVETDGSIQEILD